MNATEGMARQAAWVFRVTVQIRRLTSDPDHRIVWSDLTRLWRAGYAEADAVRKYLADHHVGEGS